MKNLLTIIYILVVLINAHASYTKGPILRKLQENSTFDNSTIDSNYTICNSTETNSTICNLTDILTD